MADVTRQAGAATYIADDTAAETKIGPERPRLSIGKALMYVLLIGFAVVAMVPFYWMLSTSLMSLGETINRVWFPADPVAGLANYVEAWDQAKFSTFFLNSVIITGLTIIGLLVTSIFAAYAFARINFTGKNTVFTLLLITLMIPESVTMIPNYLTVGGGLFPLPQVARDDQLLWFGGSWINTYAALTIPFMANAFSIFLLRQFFATIPDELWDAARIDGAGHFRFLIQIVLPIARPAILTVTLLAFIASWNAFLWPLLVTTRDDVRPLMVGLYNFTSEGGSQTHLLMAASTITILPIILLYFVTQKSFTEGIATSGLKG